MVGVTHSQTFKKENNIMNEYLSITLLIGICIWIIYNFVMCLRRKNITPRNLRNPDTAEEDDIGPIDHAVYYESAFPQQVLLMELRRYYDDAAISFDRRKRAFEVVDGFKNSLQKFVRNESKTDYTFGEILPQGSSYEGLKVIKADEFDLLLPLIVDDNDWRCTEAADSEYQAPGYAFITKIHGYIYNKNTPYDNAIVNRFYLSPIEIKRKMQSIVKRAVNKMVFPNVQPAVLRESGPALTIDVWYDNSQRMSIDIVPSIKIGKKMLVAKRHDESDLYQCRTDHNMFNNLWRVSFSEEEKLMIREMDGENECRRACLKILKTIHLRKGSSQLGMLSSYHLKTCMLHLNDDRNTGSWHQDNLDNRFKDLLRKLIQFLEDEKMPSFFDPKIDLFSTYNTIQLQNIRGWLERIVRSDNKIIQEMLL